MTAEDAREKVRTCQKFARTCFALSGGLPISQLHSPRKKQLNMSEQYK